MDTVKSSASHSRPEDCARSPRSKASFGLNGERTFLSATEIQNHRAFHLPRFAIPRVGAFARRDNDISVHVYPQGLGDVKEEIRSGQECPHSVLLGVGPLEIDRYSGMERCVRTWCIEVARDEFPPKQLNVSSSLRTIPANRCVSREFPPEVLLDMKWAVILALFFTEFSAVATESPFIATVRAHLPVRKRVEKVSHRPRTPWVTRTTAVKVSPANGSRPLPVVAAREEVILTNVSPNVDGVLPRLLTARIPAQMINPLAPPEYGSAADLMIYTDSDPHRTTNASVPRVTPYGIRLLTIQPLW